MTTPGFALIGRQLSASPKCSAFNIYKSVRDAPHLGFPAARQRSGHGNLSCGVMQGSAYQRLPHATLRSCTRRSTTNTWAPKKTKRTPIRSTTTAAMHGHSASRSSDAEPLCVTVRRPPSVPSTTRQCSQAFSERPQAAQTRRQIPAVLRHGTGNVNGASTVPTATRGVVSTLRRCRVKSREAKAVVQRSRRSRSTNYEIWLKRFSRLTVG